MRIGKNKVLKSAREMDSNGILAKGWTSLRETFAIFWKRRFFVFISFLLVCFALNGYHYIQSHYTSSTVVSLDYEEAAKGLTPSQTRFNIFEIESSEVMERLISVEFSLNNFRL